MKKLENLTWSPKWVSHLGCIKGCLDYLKLNITDAWLYGATGHAFIINMSEVVCPSSPTAWKTMKLFELGKNIGYHIEGVFGFKSDQDFAGVQKQAWEHARQAIDQGFPCYGWELEVPEYYVVLGYDHVGYYYSGPMCGDGKGPKPWQELGGTDIGVIELYSVKPGKAADEVSTVRQAFEFALEHAQSPDKWILPRYKAGLEGFDYWINSLQKGTAHGMGMAYNAAVWEECRRYGVAFLKEAKARLKGATSTLFDEAIEHYETVTRHLKGGCQLYPFEEYRSKESIDLDDKSQKAVDMLKKAREAEALGLRTLEKIVSRLEGR
ncbi:MAG: hypothetical protein AB1345_05125 [Chloroflexota bacterium]